MPKLCQRAFTCEMGESAASRHDVIRPELAQASPSAAFGRPHLKAPPELALRGPSPARYSLT